MTSSPLKRAPWQLELFVGTNVAFTGSMHNIYPQLATTALLGVWACSPASPGLANGTSSSSGAATVASAGSPEAGSSGALPGSGGASSGSGGGPAGSAGARANSGGDASTGAGSQNSTGGSAGAATVPVAGSTCAIGDPFLAANGTSLRNAKGAGDVVTLRGANLGGWLLLEPYMSPVNDATDDYGVHQTLTSRFGADQESSLLLGLQKAWVQTDDFVNMANLGMNAARVPFSYANMQNDDGTMRADAFDRLDFAVSEAWKHCIYSVLDLHGAWGNASTTASGGRVGPADLFTNTDDQQKTQQLWEAVAAHYKGNPAVAGYDLINEPSGGNSDQDRWNLQDRFYKAVRAVDPDHVIFIEAIWWLDNLPNPSQYGWKNVVYECHHYDWDSTNDANALKQGADAKVTDWLSHASYNVPFFLGEFNFFGVSDAWNYGIAQWDKAQISWTTWSWRAAVDGGDINNSWGVYNPKDPRPAKPSMTNDSASTISNDWSQWNSGAFGINPMLKTALAAPETTSDQYQTGSGQILTVAAPGVLKNDQQLNGASLQVAVVADPAHGSLTLNPDGSFTYTPASGFQGQDAFTYQAFDGRLHSPMPAVVRITVQ